MMRKIAFPPLVNSDSRILLLGTMPGEESLRKQQYYGHKQNHFWKIIYSIFNTPFSDDYEERKALILSKGIALWDVLESCEGCGSLDSSIKNEQPNDFECFYKKYPQIKHVIFTSKKASGFYKKYVGLDAEKTYITLPSPSPAHARMTLQQKTEKWKILLDILSNC